MHIFITHLKPNTLHLCDQADPEICVCVCGGGGTKIHAAAFLGRIIFLEFHVMTKIWENETNRIPPNSIEFNSNRPNKWIYYVNEADRIG